MKYPGYWRKQQLFFLLQSLWRVNGHEPHSLSSRSIPKAIGIIDVLSGRRHKAWSTG
jgi:hypothetical protein